MEELRRTHWGVLEGLLHKEQPGGQTHGTWGHLRTVGLLPIVNVCCWAMEGELMSMRSSTHENISCFRVIRDVEEQGRASAAEAR